MIRRLRRPASLVWLVAVPFAILVGLAIAGTPFVTKDVPLKDRGAATAPPASTKTTTTTTKTGG